MMQMSNGWHQQEGGPWGREGRGAEGSGNSLQVLLPQAGLSLLYPQRDGGWNILFKLQEPALCYHCQWNLHSKH